MLSNKKKRRLLLSDPVVDTDTSASQPSGSVNFDLDQQPPINNGALADRIIEMIHSSNASALDLFPSTNVASSSAAGSTSRLDGSDMPPIEANHNFFNNDLIRPPLNLPNAFTSTSSSLSNVQSIPAPISSLDTNSSASNDVNYTSPPAINFTSPNLCETSPEQRSLLYPEKPQSHLAFSNPSIDPTPSSNASLVPLPPNHHQIQTMNEDIDSLQDTLDSITDSLGITSNGVDVDDFLSDYFNLDGNKSGSSSIFY